MSTFHASCNNGRFAENADERRFLGQDTSGGTQIKSELQEQDFVTASWLLRTLPTVTPSTSFIGPDNESAAT